ncbi:MAG: histidine--tRNA ligase [Candidatus Omnitrophota bacterium]
MKQKIAIPRGTRDILSEEIGLWQTLESKARKIFKTYNYQEIRTPAFEQTALFSRSLGQTSDIVQKQMLNLEKEGLSLRPEGTASVVRSYIENNLDQKEQLTKLYYIGEMFRGERPQKGRYRQFHQIGAEAIGPNSRSPYLDAEVITLSINILKEFGLKDFVLNINTLGSQKDKENFSKKLRVLLKPEMDNLCEDCQERFERNALRILDCKNKKCKTVIQQCKIDDAYLCEESRNYFAQLKKALSDLGIVYHVSPHLVRGLDYYTDTVFEITSESLGAQDALGAGGRYENLVSQLGGPDVDAIGFALGIERIILALGQSEVKNQESLDVYLIALNEASLAEAFGLLNALREKSIRSDINYRSGSMKSQMRAADKSKAKFVLILGEDEIKNKEIALKDMKTGEQQKVAQEKIIEVLRGKL